MDKYDKQILVQEIKDFNFIKNKSRISFPYKFGRLPKKVSIAWNEAREKVLNNYMGYDLPEYYKINDRIEKLFPTEFYFPNLLNTFMKFPTAAWLELITTDVYTSQANAGANQLEITPYGNTGNIGDSYNQIALGEAGATGNRRIGTYDSDGLPNNLDGESAAFASETSYTYRAFTGGSFNLSTAQNWFAWISSTNNNVKYDTGATGTRYWSTRSYGVLPNPALHVNEAGLKWWGKIGLA